MKLEYLLKNLKDYKIYNALKDIDITGLSSDSKAVSGGDIFFALKGPCSDGHNFIDQAIKKGAAAIIINDSEFKPNNRYLVPVIGVKDSRLALATLAKDFYADPSGKIKVIGITGTNGKTTISYLIEFLLQALGKNPAVIGTVNYRFQDKVFPASNTTPGCLQLQALLAEMLKEQVDYVAMEVSSHALDQDRTLGVNFHYAIFTNLTQDHLDYHHNLEDYFLAKAKLFKAIEKNSCAIINLDDSYSERLIGLTSAKVITYGINDAADVSAEGIIFNHQGTQFNVIAYGKKICFQTCLIGRHNVYNILATVAFGLSEGFNLEAIKSALSNFTYVPGRLEKIATDKGIHIFVDYAHTEDALKNVITSLKEVYHQKMVVVFGCGGERDKTKRPKMGRVVSQLADYVIITSDNPRSEDPQEIVNDIKRGIEDDNYCVILNRKEAIEKALALAKTGDVVLVAGKGHETYQILKDKTIDFDDRKVIKLCLN